MINAYINHYHDRPHSRLAYRTPREVRATWDDAQVDSSKCGLTCQHRQERSNARAGCALRGARNNGSFASAADPAMRVSRSRLIIALRVSSLTPRHVARLASDAPPIA